MMPPPPVGEPALEAKVAFLRQPASYPEPAYRVEALETHMSWVFLTDGHAYKLKKPVRNELLDFGSADARRHYCEEEVRLNRRLAADVYLGIVPLAIDACGHLHLGGDGEPIDWLTSMRRLPTQSMLDYLLRNGTATDEDIRRVAARLAGFYQGCAPVGIDADSYRDRFLQDIEHRQDHLSRPAYRLAVDDVFRICAAQRSFLQKRQELFDARVQAGRIVEGHGDLRPEHVCMAPQVSIIDCLEFSRELRIIDAADEVGFLAQECGRLGGANLGALLLRSYSENSGDWPDAALLGFYQSYRALLRASIAVRHLDEEKFRYSPEWRRRAQAYLRLAAAGIPADRSEESGG